MAVVKADHVMAQIVKVLSKSPIEKADSIELITVLGWNVLAKKEEFQVGDLAIYFCIDSVLDPENPKSDFLKNSKFKGNKVLKTKKMMGVISQGLLAPLFWLADYGINAESVEEGTDVTTQMKVMKWVSNSEMEVYEPKEIGKKLPDFIPRTCEERIQNVPHKLAALDETVEIVMTTKLDGCSFTTWFYNGSDGMASRNYILDAQGSTHFHQIKKKYNLSELLRKMGKNIAIQGEICGPKINNNREQLKQMDFFVFNVYDIDKQSFLDFDSMKSICIELGLKTVPLIYKGKFKKDEFTVKNLLQKADEEIKNLGGELAEGFVFKTNNLDANDRLSVKVLSNKYCIKHKN